MNTYKKPIVLLNEDLAEGVYAASGGAGGGSGAAVSAGEYTFMEETPFGDMLWTVSIKDDGSFEFGMPENEGLGNPMWTGTGWTDNGDGTFTTPDAKGDGPHIASFWNGDSITWIDNGDGTVTPVGY